MSANVRASARPIAPALRTGWLAAALLPAAVGVIALALRLHVLRLQGWLADEIVYVDWIGRWFAEHFLEYLLQWQHTVYPPQSPDFANPPLPMWLVAGGIKLAELIGLSNLHGGRLVNAVLGTLTCLAVLRLGARYWSPEVGLIAGLLQAVAPVALATDGSAYMEPTLTLLSVVGLAAFLAYLERPSWRAAAILGTIAGLAVLSKFTIVPAVGLAGLAVLWGAWNAPRRLGHAALYGLIAALLPPLLWAGLRDPNHIQGALRFILVVRSNSGLLLDYTPLERVWYYPAMLIGTMPLAEVPFFLVGLGIGGALVARRVLGIGGGATARPVAPTAALLILFSVQLAFTALMVRGSTRHHLLYLVPLASILAASAADWLATRLPAALGAWRPAVLGLWLASVAAPALLVPGALINLYNNELVGGLAGSLRLYNSSDGTGLELAAQWLNRNTPPSARIAALAYDYVLDKYLTDGRRALPLFLNDGLEGVGPRGADYALLYTLNFQQGRPTTTVEQLRNARPVHQVVALGAPIINVYALHQPAVWAEANHTTFDPTRWSAFKRLDSDQAGLSVGADGAVRLDYAFNGRLLHWAGLLHQDLHPAGWSGVAADIKVEGPIRRVNVDLLRSGDPIYLRYSLVVSWEGWHRVYLPLSRFQLVDIAGQPVALQTPPTSRVADRTLRFVLDSRQPERGSLSVRNVAFTDNPLVATAWQGLSLSFADWRTVTRDAENRLELLSGPGTLRLDFQLAKGGWVNAYLREPLRLSANSLLQLDVAGVPKGARFYVDLLDPDQRTGYLRFADDGGWSGVRRLVVPVGGMMRVQDRPGQPPLDLTRPVELRLALDATTPLAGQVQVSGLQFLP